MAEDDPHIARLVSFKLTKEGYEVDVVENGRDLLEKLNADLYSLIMLDMMMPIMDGLTALKAIRAREGYDSMPIVMMTAKSQERDVQEALEAGATAYIVKPFDPTDLANRIAQILSSH